MQKQFRLARLFAHSIPAYMAKRGHKIGYTGDGNALDHDGTFYALKDDEIENGYVSAGRIMSGDGCRWIEDLTIILPQSLDKLASALACLGALDDPHMTAEDLNNPHLIVEALLAWGSYDVNFSDVVKIKGSDEEPDTQDPLILTENQALNMALGFAL